MPSAGSFVLPWSRGPRSVEESCVIPDVAGTRDAGITDRGQMKLDAADAPVVFVPVGEGSVIRVLDARILPTDSIVVVRQVQHQGCGRAWVRGWGLCIGSGESAARTEVLAAPDRGSPALPATSHATRHPDQSACGF
jgi:hypothetical protein